MINVLQIFRKKNPAFFSIEKVFALIEPYLKTNVNLNIVNLPYYNTGLPALLRNLYFLKRKQSASVYHITGDAHYAALVLPKKQTVLTIHDCVFLYNSKGIKRSLLKYLFLDMPVKRAVVISTISEFTRSEIIRFTNCNPAKIKVIPNPVNDSICYREKEFNSAEPVIFFIGVTPNKNLERVITALEGINCKLCILGKPAPAQENLLKKSGINFSLVYNVTEQELAKLYEDCDMVLFPSTFEGFGLPVLEGQKAGRVVITSALEPMQSVAGGGAYLVDPYNIDSIRQGIATVIENAAVRKHCINAGFENLKKYNAETIAAAYTDLYEKVAGTVMYKTQ